MKQKKPLKRQFFGSAVITLFGYGDERFVEGSCYVDAGDGTGVLISALVPCSSMDEAEKLYDSIGSYKDVTAFVEKYRQKD